MFCATFCLVQPQRNKLTAVSVFHITNTYVAITVPINLKQLLKLPWRLLTTILSFSSWLLPLFSASKIYQLSAQWTSKTEAAAQRSANLFAPQFSLVGKSPELVKQHKTKPKQTDKLQGRLHITQIAAVIFLEIFFSFWEHVIVYLSSIY